MGKNPPAEVSRLAGDFVEVTGWIPSTVPYLRRAALTVAPIRLGGGTRVKILESMAAGLPVVATAHGAEGIAVRDGVEILIAERPEQFAGAVVRLLGDSRLRKRIALAARRLVEQRYDSARTGRAFVELCEKLVACKSQFRGQGG